MTWLHGRRRTSGWRSAELGLPGRPAAGGVLNLGREGGPEISGDAGAGGTTQAFEGIVRAPGRDARGELLNAGRFGAVAGGLSKSGRRWQPMGLLKRAGIGEGRRRWGGIRGWQAFFVTLGQRQGREGDFQGSKRLVQRFRGGLPPCQGEVR